VGSRSEAILSCHGVNHFLDEVHYSAMLLYDVDCCEGLQSVVTYLECAEIVVRTIQPWNTVKGGLKD
jgi:hypothetical protein